MSAVADLVRGHPAMGTRVWQVRVRLRPAGRRGNQELRPWPAQVPGRSVVSREKAAAARPMRSLTASQSPDRGGCSTRMRA
ncbi:Uncharacterised protein [Bordetella pertussis]|nr:Uncharacterised protein [Bordetella pertussis]CFW15540.1 Uncharacterised protein [Bordetella pertussis]